MTDVLTNEELHLKVLALEDVAKQFQATGGKAHNYGVQMGVVEKAQQKLVNIWQGSVIGKAQVVGKWFGNLSKVVTKYSNDSKDMEDANKNLTIAQRHLIAPLLKGTGAAKMGQKMWEKYRHTIVDANGDISQGRKMLLMFGASLMTLLGLLGIIGFAFAAFSLATEGAASPIAQFVAEHFPQFSAGLQKIIDLLQGDMVGSIQSYLLPAFILFKVALMLLPGLFGPLFVAVVLGVALFKRFRAQGDSFGTALIKTIGGVVAAFFILMSPGKILKLFWLIVKLAVRTLGWGGSLIIAGIAGLFLAASGKLSGFWSVVIGIMSAAALYVGMLLVSAALGTTSTIGALFAAIPFFWVAALLLMVAMIYRFREPLWAAFKAIGKGIANIFIWVANLIIDILLTPFNFILAMLSMAIPGLNFSPLGAGDTIPMLADGGPVRAGRSYIVGERGPELFTAGSSGRITPNHEMGGGTSNITMNIDVGGVTDQTDKRALARQIGDALNQELRRLGGNPTRGRY